MNETTDTIDEIAPNSNVPLLVWCGVLGWGPEIAVNTSISVLDPLVGVVDGVVDELVPVVRTPVEPITGEPVGEPRPPRQHEALRDEQVDQHAGDQHRRDHAKRSAATSRSR